MTVEDAVIVATSGTSRQAWFCACQSKKVEEDVTSPQPSSNLPILDWLFSYQKEWLQYDLIAGLVTAAVVIPKAMAYATIAGLPVQVGLYTALVPMVIYALVGTSRPLSV